MSLLVEAQAEAAAALPLPAQYPRALDDVEEPVKEPVRQSEILLVNQQEISQVNRLWSLGHPWQTVLEVVG